MARISCQDAWNYAQQVNQTGDYTREELERILSARFLYQQDWISDLRAHGPSALRSLQLPDAVAEVPTSLLERAGFAIRFGLNWLMGHECGEASEVIRLLLDLLDETNEAGNLWT